jgi:uncharacterized protein
MSDVHGTGAIPAGTWTPDDLARLEALLHAAPLREHALSADALQGMFVAMAMGPDAEPGDEWVEIALGDVAPSGAQAPPELLALVERFRLHTADMLDEGRLVLLLYTLRRGGRDYATWCEGFLLGVQIAPTDWYDAADPDDVDELLQPVQVLAGALGDDERAAYSAAGWRKLVQDSQARLEETLLRLRDFWRIVRAPPVTVRHALPKVGRNDPCPCGSGRKHKQCCGR